MLCDAVCHWYVGAFKPLIIKEKTYIGVPRLPSAQLLTVFSYLLHSCYLLIICSVYFHILSITWANKSRCCTVGNHSCRLLWPQTSASEEVFLFSTYNVPSHIQMKCIHQYGYLGRGLIHMRHQPLCITGLCCLTPLSSYRQLLVLGIATLAWI